MSLLTCLPVSRVSDDLQPPIRQLDTVLSLDRVAITRLLLLEVCSLIEVLDRVPEVVRFRLQHTAEPMSSTLCLALGLVL